ncbi:MAG: hypothetical protein H6Q33_1434 [Deltaproteobacteria bacterium]|nr:hypothetical protein [Deltaproteobacteria bacterium]
MPDTTRPTDAPADALEDAEPVPLSVMTASGARFDWHEGTAVVQELCALIGSAETAASMILPDQAHVLVQPDGSLSLSSTGQRTARSAGAQVTALGQLLLSLVSESEMPVKLRLMLLSAISDAAPFATTAAFSRALAYFERPGRAADIRAVFLRWRLHPPESPAAGPPLPGAAPTKQDEPPVPSRSRRQRFAIVLAALILLIASGAAAWWFSERPGVAPMATIAHTATDLASRASVAVRGLAASGAATVRSAVGGTPEPAPAGSAADAGKVAEKPELAKSPVAKRGLKPGGAIGATPGQGADAIVVPPSQPDLPPFKAFDLSTSLVGRLPTGEAALPPAPSLQPEAGRPAGMAPRGADLTAPIYSIADRDVEPPVPVKPKIATVLPAGEREENLTVVDLMISDDGQVESLRLVRPVRGVRETMILSAVKAWQFKPALKDSQPVRYLKRIWISLSPIGGVGR